MTKDQFEQLIERYHRSIQTLIYRIVWEWETANDLAQDVFVKMWEKHNRIPLSDNIYTLLYRIAVHSAIDYLRRRKTTVQADNLTASTNIWQKTEQANLFSIIEDCTRFLKPKQKAVFIMRDMEGFGIEEIALIMNISAGSVRSNLHLARKNIREYLAKSFNITEESLYDL